MSQQKSHIQCTNILSAHLLAFTKFRVPTAFDSSERLSSEWYKPPGTCSIKILMYPSSETDPRYWTMFRCFKYLCSAISSWRGWEYLLKKKKDRGHAGKGSRPLKCLFANRTGFRDTDPILRKHLVHDLQNAVWLAAYSEKVQRQISEEPWRRNMPSKNLQMAFFCIVTQYCLCLWNSFYAIPPSPKRIQMRYNCNLNPQICLILELMIYICIIKLYYLLYISYLF